MTRFFLRTTHRWMKNQKVQMEGLDQRALGIENKGNRILTRITELFAMNGRENCSVSVARRSGTAQYAPLRSILSDRNYRQGNAQKNAQNNVQGNTKKDDVPQRKGGRCSRHQR
jgi:hypothetical protein